MKRIWNVLRTCAGNAGTAPKGTILSHRFSSGDSSGGALRAALLERFRRGKAPLGKGGGTGQRPVPKDRRRPRRAAGSVWALLLCISLLPAPAKAAENVTINVYNWGQYISDGSDGYLDVNAAFTEATGIQVNYMTFDSNESMYTKLKTGGSTYDVIIPSDYMVGRLIAEDMLEPLDFDNIPNYQYIDESFRNTAYDPDNRYSVPYTWGAVGIIYNTKYVEEITSWSALWDERYTGKILMFDNPRDAFAIAQFRLGFSVNDEDDDQFQAAAYLLREQRGVNQDYVMDQIFSRMEHEEAWIAPYYAGDYLMMAQENEALAFCYPEEGFNVFIDAMCIPKGAPHKAAAEAYINFLCDPEISGQNLEYLGYSTPLSAAKEYMDPEVADSQVAYPSAETLARGQSFLPLSDEATRQMDELWLEVKTSGDLTSYLVGFGAAAVIIAGLCLAVTLRRRKRMAVRLARKKREAGQI